jgi:hypothetical protein
MGLTLYFKEVWGYPIDLQFTIFCADAAIPLTDKPGGPVISVFADVCNLETAHVIVKIAGIIIPIC